MRKMKSRYFCSIATSIRDQKGGTILSSALAAGRVECPTIVVEKGLRLCGAACVCVRVQIRRK